MIALQKLKTQKFIDDHTSKIENKKIVDDHNPKCETISIFGENFKKYVKF